jgi:hypothetical protein
MQIVGSGSSERKRGFEKRGFRKKKRLQKEKETCRAEKTQGLSGCPEAI